MNDSIVNKRIGFILILVLGTSFLLSDYLALIIMSKYGFFIFGGLSLIIFIYALVNLFKKPDTRLNLFSNVFIGLVMLFLIFGLVYFRYSKDYKEVVPWSIHLKNQ